MSEIINENLVILDLDVDSKEECIEALVSTMDKEQRLIDSSGYQAQVLKRENQCTTGIGFGIAIPHGKCDSVKKPTVAFARLKNKLDWKSLDDEPVQIVFLLAVPCKCESNDHLRILASLSRKLMCDDFREQLFNKTEKNEIVKIINDILS